VHHRQFEKLGELSGDQVRRQAFQRILASSRFDKAGLTNVNCLKLEFDDERKTRLFVTIDNSQTLQQRQQERPPIS
jgi:hypothetical protein